MSDNFNADNPYASPEAAGREMTRRTFRIGRDEIHTIHVQQTLWTGLKTHSLDAAGSSTPTLRGPCRFQVGRQEEHQVEVQVDASARVSLLVDGKLVEENLFPRLRALVIGAVAVLLLVMTALVIGIILTSKLVTA